jgi:GT2 family glycosyltransferase
MCSEETLPRNLPIGVIAVSYFNSSDLERLVVSLQKQEVGNWNLVIVDNSMDEDEHHKIGALASTDGRVRTFFSTQNTGYMPSALVAVSLLPESRWTVICNSDVEFSDPDAFSILLDLEDSNIAVVAPRITDHPSNAELNPFLVRRPGKIWLYLRLAALSNGFLYKLMKHVHRIRSRPDDAKTDRSSLFREIYAAHGSCLILHPDFVPRLKEISFEALYGEELLIALEAKETGRKILYTPSISVVHYSHSSTGSLSERRVRGLQLAALKAITKKLR